MQAHTICLRCHQKCHLIAEVVDAVVYWPLCSWPQASCGLYDSDEEHMFYMNRAMKTAEDTEEYCRRWVHSYATPEEYLELIGREKIAKISATETAFLMDPYCKWIKSDIEAAELLDRVKG